MKRSYLTELDRDLLRAAAHADDVVAERLRAIAGQDRKSEPKRKQLDLFAKE